MAETPEIPEAKDPFERMVAVSIAAMAVCLSVINTHGDNAKTDAIIKTNEASNKWGYFQSKSIKEHIGQTQVTTLTALSDSAVQADKRSALLAKLDEEIKRYGKEKTDIKTEAEALEKDTAQSQKINDRSDHGALFLQIAIVVASVSILSRWKPLWFSGLVLGVIGAVVGLSAFAI